MAEELYNLTARQLAEHILSLPEEQQNLPVMLDCDDGYRLINIRSDGICAVVRFDPVNEQDVPYYKLNDPNHLYYTEEEKKRFTKVLLLGEYGDDQK